MLPPLARSLVTRRCRLRFGLIGYGAWGKHHAAAIRDAPGLTLAGVACGGEVSAAAARNDLPGVPVCRDYRELLLDPSIDAIDIVTPNHLHGEIGVAVLEAGKDVLLEKPMAATAELRVSVQWSAIQADPRAEASRRGATACEPLKIGASGELCELTEEIRQTAAVFRERRPLVSGVEARKRVIVCLEAERSLHEGRELSLQF